jgi:hypothetical protein
MEFSQAVFEAMIHCFICTITCHGGKDIFSDNQFIGLSVKPNHQLGSINNNLEKKHFIKLVDSIVYAILSIFIDTNHGDGAESVSKRIPLDNQCPAFHVEMAKT